jgi:transcription antitermination factor NusG
VEIFVLQIKTGGEEKFLLAARRLLPDLPGDLCFPRRKLPIRKGGKTTLKEVPLYGGYLFYRCEELDSESISLIKSIPGFGRFLPHRTESSPC